MRIINTEFHSRVKPNTNTFLSSSYLVSKIKTAVYFRPILDLYRIELYLDVIGKAQQLFNTHLGNTAYLWKPITNFHKGFNLSFDKSWKRKENTSCSYTFPQAALSFSTRSWRGRIYHILSHWQNANAALLMNIYDGTPRPRLNKFFILTWQPDKQAVWIRHVLSCRSPSWSRVRSPSAMHFSSNGPRIRMCTAARNKDMLPFKCAA